MDIYIWYTLLSAIIGGVIGARARLGEVSIIFICDCCRANIVIRTFCQFFINLEAVWVGFKPGA